MDTQGSPRSVAGPWGGCRRLTCAESNWAAPAGITDGNKQSYHRTGSTSSSYFTTCQRPWRPEETCSTSPLDKHHQSHQKSHEGCGGRDKRKGGRQNERREIIKRRRWKQISDFEQELPFLDTFLPSLTELCFLVALWVLAACGTQVRCTGSPAADIRIAVMPTVGTRATCGKGTTGKHIH